MAFPCALIVTRGCNSHIGQPGKPLHAQRVLVPLQGSSIYERKSTRRSMRSASRTVSSRGLSGLAIMDGDPTTCHCPMR